MNRPQCLAILLLIDFTNRDHTICPALSVFNNLSSSTYFYPLFNKKVGVLVLVDLLKIKTIICDGAQPGQWNIVFYLGSYFLLINMRGKEEEEEIKAV